ncbi:hypothetical protein Syun_008549 [Stephania yunnanensis]|uniref:Uncharacterized protein n=1 Tax=Stephania yunnanensis TaxID=152371 RepID=A0AAP0KFI5_9MAGN
MSPLSLTDRRPLSLPLKPSPLFKPHSKTLKLRAVLSDKPVAAATATTANKFHHCFTKSDDDMFLRCEGDAGAPVYLAAVLEYLAAEETDRLRQVIEKEMLKVEVSIVLPVPRRDHAHAKERARRNRARAQAPAKVRPYPRLSFVPKRAPRHDLVHAHTRYLVRVAYDLLMCMRAPRAILPTIRGCIIQQLNPMKPSKSTKTRILLGFPAA